MKYAIFYVLFCLLANTGYAQPTMIEGQVRDDRNIPLQNVTVTIKNTDWKTSSDIMGEFSVPTNRGDTLILTHVGHESREVLLRDGMDKIDVVLTNNSLAIQEVTINTGYYSIPKERSTGSFGIITKEQIERGASSSLLERLEGMTTGLNLDRFNIQGESGKETNSFQIRGLSTIESNAQPLIIIDDVPYNGDLQIIDPNTIESVTLLKDASAASIWGARAGNGVLVVKTKQGKFEQRTQISFRSTVDVGEKPDLYYSNSFLPAEEVMLFEKAMFNYKSYPERNQTAIPQYVEYLIANRDNQLSDVELVEREAFLSNQDTRRSALDHLYRKSSDQQYTLNISDGGSRYAYHISGSWNKNRSIHEGSHDSRKVFTFNNTFKVSRSTELVLVANYSAINSRDNKVTYSDLSLQTYGISPYLNLVNDDGGAAAIPYGFRSIYQDNASQLGLLDWRYRPVDEIDLNQHMGKQEEYRFSFSLTQKIIASLKARILYNYRTSSGGGTQLARANSYYARNMINRFTQQNGERIVPNGAILTDLGNTTGTDNTARLQLDYDWNTNEQQSIYAVAGAEIRQSVLENSPLTRLYGYDEDLKTGVSQLNFNQRYNVRPTGTANINIPVGNYLTNTDRYLSYYANASYNLKEKYILSSSVRWDGSNIYGVKANQKGVPLWSVGTSWDISKEEFFNVASVGYLRFRITYGSSGNTNHNISAYPIVYYAIDQTTGLRSAIMTNPGNPYIKWEKINTVNVGLDYRIFADRISGSVEYYNKNSSDLIADQYLDPTKGLSPGFLPTLNSKTNYANLRTKGLDVNVTTRNMVKQLKWNSTFLFSYVRDEVTHYVPSSLSSNESIAMYFYPITRPPVQVGNSLNTVYALPWNGLNAQGMPSVMEEGNEVTDYRAYYNNFPVAELLNAGVRAAPYFGSLRNDLSWKGFDISILLLYKFGHVFKRTSMGSGDEFRYNFHADYYKRWKQPGDEQFTDVPATIPIERVNDLQVLAANNIYKNSSILIHSASYLRLQDITLGYRFKNDRLKLKNCRLFLQLRNMGLIWRENEEGIDPEYPNARYPVPFSSTLGITLDI